MAGQSLVDVTAKSAKSALRVNLVPLITLGDSNLQLQSSKKIRLFEEKYGNSLGSPKHGLTGTV